MVTPLDPNRVWNKEYVGLSTNSKPALDTHKLNNGDRFIEMDTGKIFMWDSTGSDWLPFELGGSSVAVESLTATENKTYTAPSGKAYSPVTVSVPIPEPDLEEKSVTVTENGTTTISPSEGKDGLSEVELTVNVSGGGGATEPYIEETYDESGKNLIHAVMHGYTRIRKYLFYECETLASVELPDEITYIGNYAFYSCKELNLQSLPSSLTTIGNYSFKFCNGLSELEIPSGVKTLSISTFASCANLTSVKLLGKPTLFDASVFSGCTNLTDIYVPWAQGAVNGAPWGATNATIHYNWTPTE